MKKIVVFSLLIMTLVMFVGCATEDERPDPALESQLADLSDEELADLGESISQEDSAIAGQAIKGRYAGRVSVGNSLSRREIGMIIGEGSKRLRRSAHTNVQVAKRESPVLVNPPKFDDPKTRVIDDPLIPSSNLGDCEATLEVGEVCKKDCECGTKICGYQQTVDGLGIPTGADGLQMVCEHRNSEGDACRQDIECEIGLECGLVGDYVVQGKKGDTIKNYASRDEMIADGASFWTSKLPVCQ